MAQPAIELQGTREVIGALRRIRDNFGLFKIRMAKILMQEVANVAKSNVGVDTGALRDSIHSVLVKGNPDDLHIQIKAGKPDVRRGEGKYLKGRDGIQVSIQATDQYAAAHEAKKGYMKTAQDFTKKKGLEAVAKTIKKAIESA